jgi:hypothetical protein
MDLTGGQRKQLREALQAAFLTWDALSRMVDEELDVPLNTIVAVGPMPDVVYKLIQWAQANGRIKELLDKACAANPGNPELAALKNVFSSKAGEKVQPVNHLLDVLSQLLENKEVSGKVFAFRHFFQTARDQIALLGDYKELHDTLHDIQMGLYERIEKAIGCITEQQEQVKEELRDYRLTLNDTYIKRVWAITGRKSVAAGEAILILAKLEQVSENLLLGIDQVAPKALQIALRCLTVVLTTRPPLIDQALFQASQTLPLRGLVSSLEVVCQEIGRLILDPEKMGQFTRGIEALQRLDISMTMMIDAHSKWQEVDIQLRRIEFSLYHDTTELVLTWPELKGQAERLARSNFDGWGGEFLADTAALDASLALPDVETVQRSFKRCRRKAARRFYDIDKMLKEQCGLLRTTCEPLDTILGMI